MLCSRRGGAHGSAASPSPDFRVGIKCRRYSIDGGDIFGDGVNVRMLGSKHRRIPAASAICLPTSVRQARTPFIIWVSKTLKNIGPSILAYAVVGMTWRSGVVAFTHPAAAPQLSIVVLRCEHWRRPDGLLRRWRETESLTTYLVPRHVAFRVDAHRVYFKGRAH